MKGILYFFGGCLVIGLLLSLVVSQMPVLPMAGKSVLYSFSKGQYKQAYGFFSEDFRKKHSLETFTTMVQQSGLQEYQDVEWFKNVIDKPAKRGYLTGMVITNQNKRIFVEFDFIQESGGSLIASGWQLNDLRVGRPGDKPPVN